MPENYEQMTWPVAFVLVGLVLVSVIFVLGMNYIAGMQ